MSLFQRCASAAFVQNPVNTALRLPEESVSGQSRDDIIFILSPAN